MDPTLGEIRIFAGNYAPIDWALCDGSSVRISDNQQLFALLGTTWGGDGTTSFKLPDLRGRVPIGQGQGTGLTKRVLAQTGGTEAVTLTTATLPNHTHSLNASTDDATTNVPGSSVVPAKPTAATPVALYAETSAVKTPLELSAQTIQTTGHSQPHENRMPGLAMCFIICTNGLYPTRSSHAAGGPHV